LFVINQSTLQQSSPDVKIEILLVCFFRTFATLIHQSHIIY
jgi:hypothetical protein